MGKYPIDITDEENAKLKHPFLPVEKYYSVSCYPDGSTIIVRNDPKKIPKACIDQAVKINQEIAAKRILAEQDIKENPEVAK